MLLHLFIGTLLIGLTVIVHALAFDRLMVLIEKAGPRMFFHFRMLWKVPVLIMTVLGVFAAHVTAIWIWALFYVAIGEFSTLEAALYYSTSCYTTLGFGDVVLDENWRLVSRFEGANGMVLFGWSTAFIFDVMSKLYKSDSIRKT